MTVEELLDELEEILQESWNLPLTGGKGFVDINRIKDLSAEIRDTLPNELKQAKAIVADRAKIITTAKDEAESIISAAEEKAKLLVEKEEIVVKAKTRSENILLEAKTASRNIKKATNDYVDDIMRRTDDFLNLNLSELRKARQELKNPTKSAE